MKTLGSPYLTTGYADELARQIGQSVGGMAHFAATGPFGETCKDCAAYGYHRVIYNKAGNVVGTRFKQNCCAKYRELTSRYGGPIPPETEACKYFTKAK